MESTPLDRDHIKECVSMTRNLRDCILHLLHGDHDRALYSLHYAHTNALHYNTMVAHQIKELMIEPELPIQQRAGVIFVISQIIMTANRTLKSHIHG